METSSLLFDLCAMVLLLIVNGFFVAVEFAYVTVPRPRIDQLSHKGDPRATRVQKLLADTDRVLATSQAGITAASLGLGWFGENATKESLRLAFGALPLAWDTAIAQSVGIALAFGVITTFHIVLGEQAPKIMAIHAADRFALVSARLVMILDKLFSPFVWFLNHATSTVVHWFGAEPVGAHQTIYSTEELMQLVSETQATGEITAREKEMIHHVFEFGDLRVREVMTPRPGLITVDEHTTVKEFLQTFSRHPHARFPIESGNIDNIVGYVGVKDVLAAIATTGVAALDEGIRAISHPALFVPESNRVGGLFSEMQAAKIQMAIVIDEFGGTAGMLTLDHLTEQIVGRVADELTQEAPHIEKINDKTVQFDAQMQVEEANEQLGLGLPTSEDYETVSGFILYALRRVPKEGDHLNAGSLRITVVRMKGPKIERVAVTQP